MALNGGDVVARVLQDQGVSFVFTLCGGYISPNESNCQPIPTLRVMPQPQRRLEIYPTLEGLYASGGWGQQTFLRYFLDA